MTDIDAIITIARNHDRPEARDLIADLIRPKATIGWITTQQGRKIRLYSEDDLPKVPPLECPTS